MVYSAMFIVLFSTAALLLTQISKESKFLHLIPSFIFFIVFFINKVIFLSLFFSFFHLFLFLIYLEGSLEKFKSKFSLSSHLALFSSAIAFFFLMNVSYSGNFIANLGNNAYLNNFLEKQISMYYENSIKPKVEDQLEQLEDQKDNFLQQIEKQKNAIKNNEFLDNEEKEQQLAQLDEQVENYLKKYEEAKKEILNQKDTIIKEVKKQFNSMLESLTQNSLIIKAIVVPTFFFLYQIYLMFSNFLATLMLLLLRIFLRIKEERS